MRSSLLVALTAMVGMAAATIPTGAAGSGSVPVEVRVATFKGKVLADRKVTTGTATVPTSSRAKCLGGDPPNGKRKIEGATALGALADLSRQVRGLDPLLLSAAYDFGIGVCGIGDAVASGKQWWALKVNGKLASTGGDTTMLRKGDRVLWYLDRDYEAALPGELRLGVTGGSARTQLKVRVFSLDSAGKRSPVAGAKIFAGGSEVGVTNGKGRTSLRVPANGRKRVSVIARLAGHIPSNRLEVGNGS